MSKPDTWMPFYWADFLVDTTHLDEAQTGAYVLLLGHSWMRGGVLPDDDAQLARLARCTPSRWRQHRKVLEAFFVVGEGQWVQKRLMAELEKAQAVYDSSVENGKKGGRPRTQTKPPGSDPVNPPDNRPGNPDETQSQSHNTKNSKTLTPLSSSPSAPLDVVMLPASKGPSKLRQDATEILEFLNEKTGRYFRATDTTLKPIMQRLKEGHDVSTCKAVVVRKWRQWKDDDRMRQFLRPMTLFGAEKFSQYLGEVPTEEAMERENAN